MAARLPVHRATANLIATLVAVVVVACGDQASSHATESLAHDSDRLQVILQHCRADPARSDDQLCRAASEAWRRRFFGNGGPYARPSSTPRSPVAPAPSASEPTPWMAGT